MEVEGVDYVGPLYFILLYFVVLGIKLRAM
jgi:hypothetical protein